MTPEQAATIRDAIEAMSEATRTWRKVWNLPGDSRDVPGWVAWLDRSQVELAELIDPGEGT